MQKKNLTALSKPALCLIAVQLVILLSALMFWLVNRGDAVRLLYSPEEYICLANVSVTDIVAIREDSGFEGDFIKTPRLILDRGTYQLQINYNATSDHNSVSVHTE